MILFEHVVVAKRFLERQDFLEGGEGSIKDYSSLKDRHKIERETEEEQARAFDRQTVQDREVEKAQFQPGDAPPPSIWASSVSAF